LNSISQYLYCFPHFSEIASSSGHAAIVSEILSFTAMLVDSASLIGASCRQVLAASIWKASVSRSIGCLEILISHELAESSSKSRFSLLRDKIAEKITRAIILNNDYLTFNSDVKSPVVNANGD